MAIVPRLNRGFITNGGGSGAVIVFDLKTYKVLGKLAAVTAWLAEQQSAGTHFRPDQRRWLEAIRDHIASSVAVEPDDLELDQFNRWGGVGRAQLNFGGRFLPLFNELNEVLAA